MKLKVNKDKVKIIEGNKVESGEYNITELEFEFTEEYESLVKVAVFTNSYGSYKVDIVDNKCSIANEVLEKADTVKIGVYAYKSENEELQLRYSPTPTYFKVKEGSYVKNANNSEEPTPSEVEILEARIQQNADNIETLDEVISGLHNYDDTEIKNDISVLEDKVDNLHNYDDTGIKQDISSIERKNTEQDTSIQNLQNNKADKTEIPTNLSDLNEDTTHRTVTDVEKESWNNKSEFSGSYNDLTDKPSIPTKTSDITNDSGFIDKDVNNLTNYELKTNTGSSIALSINSSTYAMTLQLKNSANQVLSEGTIDLPLETMVVNASYDNSTKEVVLTLQSGTTTRFSVADLVSGLVSTTDLNTVLASYYTKTEIDNLLGGKVDKVAGKGLSTEDYTTEEKTKLAGLENYDDSELVEQIEALETELEQTQTELAETNLKLDRTRASLPTVSGEGEYVTLDGTSEDEFIEAPLPMGKTEQTTYKGIQLLKEQGFSTPTSDFNFWNNSITNQIEPKEDGWGRIYFDNSSGTGNAYRYTYIKLKGIDLEEETQYTAIVEIRNIASNNTVKSITFCQNRTEEAFATAKNVPISKGTNKFLMTTKSDFTGVYLGIRMYTYVGAGDICDYEIRVSIVKGDYTSTDYTYEPYVGGTASPNPDYPQEIKNVSGDVNVTVGNKNLFDIDNANWILFRSYYPATYDSNNDGWYNHDYMSLEFTPAKQQTISFKIKKRTKATGEYPYSAAWNLSKDGSVVKYNTGSSSSEYVDVNYTMEAGHKYSLMVYNPVFINYIQLEQGSTATSYVPHQQQTFTFPLSTGQKLMEGDYLADDGVHHVRNQTTESGTTITLSDAKNNGVYVCNKKTTGNLVGQTLTFDEAVTDAIIEYELAEEIIEPYTEAQQTAYNNIKKALSYSGQTNIYSTNEVSPTFKVKAYADVSSEIDNLKTAIVALGGVV